MQHCKLSDATPGLFEMISLALIKLKDIDLRYN